MKILSDGENGEERENEAEINRRRHRREEIRNRKNEHKTPWRQRRGGAKRGAGINWRQNSVTARRRYLHSSTTWRQRRQRKRAANRSLALWQQTRWRKNTAYNNAPYRRAASAPAENQLDKIRRDNRGGISWRRGGVAAAHGDRRQRLSVENLRLAAGAIAAIRRKQRRRQSVGWR